MNRVKFSLFSDLHHCPGTFRSNTPENLFRIQERAERERVDFIIHCGDMTHAPGNEREFMALYNEFSIPSYNCLGNHDTDRSSFEEALEVYRMPGNYYYFDVNGFRMIVLDTNYLRHEGAFVHFSMANYFKFGDERDWMPPEELEFLENALETAPGRCVLFNHSSFERCDGVQNREEVRELIRRVNARHPGRVLMCVNGHFHRDHMSILDNVAFFEINSASYEWVSAAHDLYPAEECEKIRLLNHSVCWSDPIHAVVTLSEDGEIRIEGMRSEFWLGVRREDTPNEPYDPMGRPVRPYVSDYRLKLL